MTESHHAPAVTSALAPGDQPDHIDEMSEDEAALAALGYKQEFKREFSAWTTFAVSFAVMGLLPSIATTMWYGIGYGNTRTYNPHRLCAEMLTEPLCSGTGGEHMGLAAQCHFHHVCCLVNG